MSNEEKNITLGVRQANYIASILKDFSLMLPEHINLLEDILRPLDNIILDSKLMDSIIVNVAIPELLDSKQASHHGVVLYGPPGTGKTEILHSLVSVYKNAGAYVKVIDFTDLLSKWVNASEHNLEREIKSAIKASLHSEKPSLIALDEGDNLLLEKSQGSQYTDRMYAEFLNSLKRHLNNNENLVVILTTNKFSNMDDSLLREGRLTKFLIDYPGKNECVKLFQHLFNKYGLLELSDMQANELTNACTGFKLTGAFIDSFASNYIGFRRAELLKLKGYSSYLSALKSGFKLSDEEVRRNISYDTIKSGLAIAIRDRLKDVTSDKTIYC